MHDSSLKPRLGQKKGKRRPRVCQADKLESHGSEQGACSFSRDNARNSQHPEEEEEEEKTFLRGWAACLISSQPASQPYLVQKEKQRAEKMVY